VDIDPLELLIMNLKVVVLGLNTEILAVAEKQCLHGGTYGAIDLVFAFLPSMTFFFE